MSSFEEMETEAARRTVLHNGSPSQRPLSEGYELVGIAGEVAVAELFGIDRTVFFDPLGDGGIDHSIRCEGRWRTVDVKTFRKPANLLVEEGKCIASTIYILAKYDDYLLRAFCIGWEWGSKLLKVTPKDITREGILNHYIAARALRPLHEIILRHARETARCPHCGKEP